MPKRDDAPPPELIDKWKRLAEQVPAIAPGATRPADGNTRYVLVGCEHCEREITGFCQWFDFPVYNPRAQAVELYRVVSQPAACPLCKHPLAKEVTVVRAGPGAGLKGR